MRTIGAEIGRIFVAKQQSEQQHTHFCCFSFSLPQRNEYTSDFSAVLTHRQRITCGIFRKKNRLNRTYIRDVTGKKRFFGHGHQPGTQQPLFFFDDNKKNNDDDNNERKTQHDNTPQKQSNFIL